jgi:hypothetical protein
LKLDWVKLAQGYNSQLDLVVRETAKRTLASLSIDDVDLFDLVQEDALAWSKQRAAEMVGKKYTKDGRLINNSNAKWAITDSTRDGLRDLISNAYAEGIDVTQLAQQIEDSYLFSPSRAQMIARTELAQADSQTTLIAWKESGVVSGKQSILGSEHDEAAFDCDCAEIADEGVIDLEDSFLGEYFAPPYHPNCICALVTQMLSESGEVEAE